jgi:hypothetical protein
MQRLASRFERRTFLGVFASVAGVAIASFAVAADGEDATTPAGKRVFFTGHSFHMFVPAKVQQIAQAAGIEGHTLAGTQSIGGSRVIQHWELPDEKNKAKPALSGGQVDVFTMAAHVAIPDEGITRFVELGLKHNPNLRLLVQASWFPYDVPDEAQRVRENTDRDQAQIADLQAAVDHWRKQLELQVAELNREHGNRSVHIVPAGDAVIKLRERVTQGKYPGISKQSELFRDPIGHGLADVQWLVAYCNFVAIYGLNPEGLKVPGDGLEDAQRAILQRIAWETVTSYPYSGVAAAGRR